MATALCAHSLNFIDSRQKLDNTTAKLLGTTLAVALFLLTTHASAQTGADPLNTDYGMGALFPSPDEIAGFPKAKPPLKGQAPPKADIAAFMPTVKNQGLQQSCVAWSIGYAQRSYYLNKIDHLNISDPSNVPSPAYIYGLEAGMRDNCIQSGMPMFRALNTLKAGVVSLAELPYNERQCAIPPLSMQGSAHKFRIGGWEYINPQWMPNTIKLKVSQGHPVGFDISVSQSFLQHRGGSIYTRVSNQPYIGGHAMVIVGYDDARRAFRIQNSWGTGWGNNGLAWLSYETFQNDAHGAYLMLP